MKTLTISKEYLDIINQYANLKLENKEITVPYLINKKNNKDLRVMVGKGNPEEIKMEAKIWEKLKGLDFNIMSREEIKQFLTDKRIGIDCSGFIVQTLDLLYLMKYKKHIFNKFNIGTKNILSILRFKLRPVENLGADLITNKDNTDIIEVSNVKPYDLIRSKAASKLGDHVMIVTKVDYDDNNLPVKIEYVHSTPHFGDLNGIKFGEIKIRAPRRGLEEQEWLETDIKGKSTTYEGYITHTNDNGIRRLKFKLD